MLEGAGRSLPPQSCVLVIFGAIPAFKKVQPGYGGLTILDAYVPILITMSLALTLLYRFGPNRGAPVRWRWWTPGSAAATLGWLAGSYGFSLYVSRFATFNHTYGSLGALVVLMSWLYVSAFLVLLGALVDVARYERARDSVNGRR